MSEIPFATGERVEVVASGLQEGMRGRIVRIKRNEPNENVWVRFPGYDPVAFNYRDLRKYNTDVPGGNTDEV